MKTFKVILFCILSLTSTFAFSARVFTCGGGYIRHTGTSATWQVHTGGFPSGSSQNSALLSAIGRMNERLTFQIGTTTTSTYGDGDGVGQIYWSSPANFPGGGSPLARTRYWYNMSTCKFTEIDIVFNNSYAWNFTEALNHTPFNPPTAQVYNLHGVATHELGHALGLDHEERVYNIMGDSFSHLSFDATYSDYTVGGDMMAGHDLIYGSYIRPGVVDDSITIMKRDAINSPTTPGSYSKHKEAEIIDGNTSLPVASYASTTVGPNRRNRVKRGGVYAIPYTVDVMNRVAHNLNFQAAISTDRVYDLGDIPLATLNLSFTGATEAFEKTLYTIIPSTAPLGDQFLTLDVTSCSFPGSSTPCNNMRSYDNSTYYKIYVEP